MPEFTPNLRLKKQLPYEYYDRESDNENFAILDEAVADVTQQLAQTEEQVSDIVVSVKSFGAVGDGVIDDTDAFIATRDYILSNGGVFYVPPEMNCYLPNGVDLFNLKKINIRGTITGNGTDKHLVLGIRSQVVFPSEYHINSIKNLKLKLQGVKNGHIHLENVDYLLLWANGGQADIASVAYSNFYLGNVNTVELNSENGQGWINENKFFGGRVTNLIIDGSYTHNHNHFYGCTFESSNININRGSSNQIINARFEGVNTIRFGELSFDNLITKSWTSAAGGFLRGDGIPTYEDFGVDNVVDMEKVPFYKIDEVLNLNNENLKCNLNHIIKTSDELEVTFEGKYKNIFETDLILINEDFGAELISDASIWRLYFKLFDENKEPITTNTGQIISGDVAWDNSSKFFNNSTNRKSVKAAIIKGTAKYVKIYAQSHHATDMGQFTYLKILFRYKKRSNFNYKVLTNKRATISSIPTKGLWLVGDEAYFETLTGGYRKAVCTVSGTPGTWKRYGQIEA